jgi:hypothetical protein
MVAGYGRYFTIYIGSALPAASCSRAFLHARAGRPTLAAVSQLRFVFCLSRSSLRPLLGMLTIGRVAVANVLPPADVGLPVRASDAEGRGGGGAAAG